MKRQIYFSVPVLIVSFINIFDKVHQVVNNVCDALFLNDFGPSCELKV